MQQVEWVVLYPQFQEQQILVMVEMVKQVQLVLQELVGRAL